MRILWINHHHRCHHHHNPDPDATPGIVLLATTPHHLTTHLPNLSTTVAHWTWRVPLTTPVVFRATATGPSSLAALTPQKIITTNLPYICNSLIILSNVVMLCRSNNWCSSSNHGLKCCGLSCVANCNLWPWL